MATGLTLKIHEEGDEAIVTCTGQLVFGVTDTLSSEVKPLMKTHKKVVLDLSALEKMDSLGLGTIVRLVVAAKTSGCQFELINLSQRIRQLFGITNVISIFESCGEQRMRLP
jgi:anti-anti-sigma factor